VSVLAILNYAGEAGKAGDACGVALGEAGIVRAGWVSRLMC